MISDAAPKKVGDRKAIARTFLRLANADYRRVYDQRGYYARIARQHGLTNQDIADEYGITEGAVRAIIQRSGTPDCNICKDRPKRGHYCADCGMQGASE